jgi:hypothetical protein
VKLRADGGGERLDETASLDGRMKGKPARYAFAGAGRIIHHILWQHLRSWPHIIVSKWSFQITRLSQFARGIDHGIFSNEARRTDHSPTLPYLGSRTGLVEATGVIEYRLFDSFGDGR